MIFLGFILGVFLFFFIIFVIRRIIYRTKLLMRIKKKNVVNFKVLNPLFFISRNSTKKFDFCVETEDKIYYIKLFSILRKLSQVVFDGAKDYRYKSYYLRSIRYGVEEFHKMKMSQRDVEIKEFKSKSVQKVLLFCPVCRYIVSKFVGGSIQEIFPGDYVDDYLFSNSTYFLSLLNNKELW